MDNVRYFDEMNIIQEDKELRTQMCNDLSDRVENLINEENADNWEQDFKKILIAWLVLYGYLNTEESSIVSELVMFSSYEIGLTDAVLLSISDKNEKWYVRKIAESIAEDATNTVQKTVKDIEDGTSERNSKSRADVIARDATNKYTNEYNRKIALDMGMKYHTWISQMDKRTRRSHAATDHQQKPITEPFEVNGYYMMYPMDSTYGAPIDEIAGCRCTEIFC